MTFQALVSALPPASSTGLTHSKQVLNNCINLLYSYFNIILICIALIMSKIIVLIL